MAVPKFVAKVACGASLVLNIFGSYLEHTIDPGGRSWEHKQLRQSVKRTSKETRDHHSVRTEGNLGTRMRASPFLSKVKATQIVFFILVPITMKGAIQHIEWQNSNTMLTGKFMLPNVEHSVISNLESCTHFLLKIWISQMLYWKKPVSRIGTCRHAKVQTRTVRRCTTCVS
jgi:hypothetical protein